MGSSHTDDDHRRLELIEISGQDRCRRTLQNGRLNAFWIGAQLDRRFLKFFCGALLQMGLSRLVGLRFHIERSLQHMKQLQPCAESP